jgi:GntR family transcriptional regulator/MocR family aminotransferase
LDQAVLAGFIAEGHFARHIRRMRMLYADRRAMLMQAMELQMGEALEVVGTEAGMHLVAMLPPGISDIAVSSEAARKGVSAMPLSACCMKGPTRGGLVLRYGGTNAHRIHEGLRRLRICVRG